MCFYTLTVANLGHGADPNTRTLKTLPWHTLSEVWPSHRGLSRNASVYSGRWIRINICLYPQCTLKMAAVRSSETSLNLYQTTRPHCHETFKFCNILLIFRTKGLSDLLLPNKFQWFNQSLRHFSIAQRAARDWPCTAAVCCFAINTSKLPRFLRASFISVASCFVCRLTARSSASGRAITLFITSRRYNSLSLLHFWLSLFPPEIKYFTV
jgi:hypothetical protein